MSKELKTLITDEFRSRYDGVDSACVVDVTALNVQDVQTVRRSLAGKSIRLTVVKNSLARRALDGGPLELLGRDLSGPCALVTGGDSIIDVAREVVRLAGEFPNLVLKKGVMDGDPELTLVTDLAKLKGRAELLADIAGLIGSPGGAIAGCLAGAGGRIAGCLKTIADKGES